MTQKHLSLLAGGVGGAKFAYGVMRALPDPASLTVIVNVGDDFEHFGLKICPDLDTVCYTLAGLENPATGWGRRGESWRVMEAVAVLGGPDWFRLGDLDLATHLERTRRLRAGQPLHEIAAAFCKTWGVKARVLPVTNESVPTVVLTDEGELAFQEYFVRKRWQPRVRGFRFVGAENARPAPGVLESLRTADAVLIAPSNPFVSIDPILAIPGVRDALAGKPVLAVSPIIGGKAVKGPAAKMFRELGYEPSAAAVAEHYRGLVSHFVLDEADADQAAAVREIVPHVLVTDTLMTDATKRVELARTVLSWLEREP